jgi:hypothetical protein
MEHANQQVAAKHRHGLRDAHAKSHGVLAGELRIQPDLPGPLALGLFAGPRSYPVIVRLSTAPGEREDSPQYGPHRHQVAVYLLLGIQQGTQHAAG